MSLDSRITGFNALLGLRLAQWDTDLAVVELEIDPAHLNRSGVLHGGVLATLIDVAGGFAGCYCPVPGHVRRAVTLALSTSFTGQARAGVIRAVGRRRAGGRRIYTATTEISDAGGRLIALGEGTYRYRSGSEAPEGVPDSGR